MMRAATAKPMMSTYSKIAQPQLKRAESLMPRAATMRTRMQKTDPTRATRYVLLAAELLKKKGAKQILACVSHAILKDLGLERLRKSSIDELITTDTVLRPASSGMKINTLSVAGLLGEAIKRIHSNSSVTSLFEFKGGRTS